VAELLRIRGRDDEGQTTSEYTIILMLITAAIVLAIGLLSTNLGAYFTKVANLVGL
jgi:Flp pilus assembly pilin Flp